MAWFSLDDHTAAGALHTLAQVVRSLGDARRADNLDLQGLALFRALGDRAGVVACLAALVRSAEARGDTVSAAALAAEASGVDAPAAPNLAPQIVFKY